MLSTKGLGFILLSLLCDQLLVLKQAEQVHQLSAAIQSVLLLFRYVLEISTSTMLTTLIRLSFTCLADILPLVEFEVDPELTHEEIQLLLGKSSTARTTSSERRSSVNWSEKREDFYSHDSLVTENDNERFNILAANEHVNPNTNLIILGKSELAKLDPAHLVTITDQYRKDQSEPQFKYFLNMMPEISIIACSHCSKVN